MQARQKVQKIIKLTQEISKRQDYAREIRINMRKNPDPILMPLFAIALLETRDAVVSHREEIETLTAALEANAVHAAGTATYSFA